MTKIQQLLSHVFIAAALTGAAVSAAETFTPLAQAEATYTDSGIKYKNSPFGPNGYELGTGLTLGALVNERHEISLSTGYTKWIGPHNHVAGVADLHSTAEQVPLLLNYRYHLPIDVKGRFTVFAGPTLGFIHEKNTEINQNLGALPPAVIGTSSDSGWKFAGGATIGANAKIGQHWNVGLSAQVLEVASASYAQFGGATHNREESSIRPAFALSAGYSW